MPDTSDSSGDELRLDALPALPQAETIHQLVPRLWRSPGVEAIWLGGSLATGAADEYSDLDLRVAVAPEQLVNWETPDLDTLLGAPPLARQFLRFADDTFLHHLIIPNGDILDLLVQSADASPFAEPTRTLGCRSEAFARRLAASNHTSPSASPPVVSGNVRDLIVNFWVNSHKHRKVLHRNLDLMFPAATYVDWQMLMRLWYIAASGTDVTPQHFSGIHGLTELTRTVERVYGAEPLALCGAPTRTREEICAAIERYQDVIAQLGRELADRYGFAYPTALEDVARREWRAFRAKEDQNALP